MSTYRLIYYSRNALPPDADVGAQIRQILDTSRRNNSEVAITGALMFNSGCFAQILEGPREAITETFERIQRDTRHGDVTVVEYVPIERRAFGDWSMAFVGDNARDQARFGNVARESGYDPRKMDAEAIFTTMTRLVKEEEAAA